MERSPECSNDRTLTVSGVVSGVGPLTKLAEALCYERSKHVYRGTRKMQVCCRSTAARAWSNGGVG